LERPCGPLPKIYSLLDGSTANRIIDPPWPYTFRTQMTNKLRFAARLWYYFRVGYATYLTFLLGAVNTLIVVWYLAISQMPAIESFFGHFAPFAIVMTLFGVPLSVAIGWAHIKRSPAFTSETDIQAEANPYNYKLYPGYWTEAFAPVYLELLQQVTRLLEAQRLLDKEEKSRIENLETKLKTLISGGFVGAPRTTALRSRSSIASS